jgi:TolB-like protein/class 3 adenylate cyclase/Tfp pilus assembly protein PilF
MPTEPPSDVKFEIGHVLFIDIVGYSKLLINEQSEQIQTLRKIVRGTEQVRLAEAEGKLLRLPTGDGGALVFRTTPEAPVVCALEISKELKKHPELRVRMGIHSGPVSEVTDLNEHANIAGAGINIAQRVMDCGDAGHILLSRHVAEDLEHYPRWQPSLHELGDYELKHGVRVSVVNLYTDDAGNAALPTRLAARKRSSAKGKQSTGFRTLLVAAVILIGLGVPAIIFTPAILKSLRSSTVGDKAGPSSIPEKSIAVLPFQNLSDDKSNAYFADGIQDEILTRLSKIAALKVISRTSTQKYKSAPDNLREIGKQLRVAHLLEGSVQRIANAVHINVQLIRAATDEHIWAESYNRKLDDVFGVQGEVASAIADQLNAKLTGAEEKAVTEKPTQNVAAYDAYLRGLSIEHARYGFAAYQEAAADYAQAVELDPKFALAWAHLGMIRSFLFFNGVDTNTNSAAAVKQAADQAIALEPDLAEAWIAQGAYRYRVLRDFSGALQAYDEGRKRLPNSSLALEYLAYVERRLGRWEEAEGHYKKAAELDPRNFEIFLSMGSDFLNLLRRFDKAHAALDRALELSPNDESSLATKANVFQSQGRLDEAAKLLARIPPDSSDDFVVAMRSAQAIFERRFYDAIEIMERKLALAKPGEPLSASRKLLLVQLGYCQAWTGQPGKAHATFAQAIQTIKPSPDFVVLPDSLGLPYFLALAYAGLGDRDRALEQAHRAVDDYATDAVARPTAETVLAQIQAGFGDFDSAIAAIPHLLEVPAGITAADLRLNPLWDPLRKDPRFQKFCEDRPK